ncbi:unnamed protein product [Clonostachys rosea]|uniref:Long chronological lifespan protein 2 n=1 Tax=Bionectria ochroleuca TaxID=29856 RepID=A0ABY6UVM7_BIOOC|nr:unnamed protein product [Clonostachys rosea]
MKLSTLVVFATTIMGATAQYGHPGLDLERREIDLERRELEFEHKARRWLAARDARNELGLRSTQCNGFCGPTLAPCAQGCICQRGSCVPHVWTPPTPPPTPPATNAKKGAKKAAPAKKHK